MAFPDLSVMAAIDQVPVPNDHVDPILMAKSLSLEPGPDGVMADPARAMRLGPAYLQATQMAKSLGYPSLEAMELHRQSLTKGKDKKKAQPETLFIGGLKKTTEDEVLQEHFVQFGEVVRCDVIRNLDGTSRGFAFVRMVDMAAVDRVLDAKFDHVIDGQWVDVRPKDTCRADAGRKASQAVEHAAMAVGVEPSQYLNYLTQVASAKYGYGESTSATSSARGSPY